MFIKAYLNRLAIRKVKLEIIGTNFCPSDEQKIKMGHI